jgi:glycosyltransferase involved in cell wall biosynthesis
VTNVRPIYFNGKFYGAELNGVHRVADRLIRECDALLNESAPADRPDMRIVLPSRRTWNPAVESMHLVEQSGRTGQFWEQILLPRQTRDGVLVNLANLAPIAHRRKVLMLHDAQFLFPDSSYPWRQTLGYKLLTPRMARSSAVVLTVSDYSRQMLDLLGVAPRQSTERLYNGADHIVEVAADSAAPAAMGLISGGYVLMFGSAKAYKNNVVVFDAFANNALAPLRLAVVGADRKALEAGGLRPPEDTVFAGKCTDAVLRALYEQAHCLAFPSRTEGFGLPPVEAMMCACPVVVAPGGAIPEVCRDAVLYADVDDPRSWRDAIGVLHDTDSRDGMVARGRVRATDFTWAKAGRRLFDTLRTLASS